jgi:YfiH family protein
MSCRDFNDLHMPAEFISHPDLTATHGFFTRRGGVSGGAYDSLNCSLSSGDAPHNLAENRRLVATSLGVAPENLLGLSQIHSSDVVVANAAWPAGSGARADALVSRTPGLALSVITADCAPVLFYDAERRIAGAAHAGWRGAISGVLEAVIAAMCDLGAQPSALVAVIGPCIAQDSYEVGPDLRDAVLAASPYAEKFFRAGRPPDRHHFDLSGYCAARLTASGASVHKLGLDTVTDELRFFSHRRRCLRGDATIGHQISVIVT